MELGTHCGCRSRERSAGCSLTETERREHTQHTELTTRLAPSLSLSLTAEGGGAGSGQGLVAGCWQRVAGVSSSSNVCYCVFVCVRVMHVCEC